MAHHAFRILALGLSLLSGIELSAQTRFYLADPQALSGAGNGWSVDPGTGALSFSATIGTVPGEIPIPAVYRIAASHASQRRTSWLIDKLDTFKWICDRDANVHRPIFGTFHFGFVDPGGDPVNGVGPITGIPESATYVLEDGTQFREEDWGPFSQYSGYFTLPQDFGLAAFQANSARISADHNYACYTTNLAGLGTAVGAKVQATLPSGHAAPTAFKVVLDKDRARIMAYLSGLKAWAPLLWLDRFGHQVAFKWAMTTTNLPAGTTALHSVTATNPRSGQPSRGLRVRWAVWASDAEEQDLLRADFIGIDAPSILVRGYSGRPALPPSGFTAVPNLKNGDAVAPMSVAGVMGRPTLISIGGPTAVPMPSWEGSAAALALGPQPAAAGPLQTLPPREWAFRYDANRAAITDMVDAMGVTTHLDYGQLEFPHPEAATPQPKFGSLYRHGVLAATSTDGQQDPASLTKPQLKRTWSRSAVANNSWTTTYQEWWPSVGASERKLELGFGSATLPSLYKEGQLALQRLVSADGAQEYTKTMLTHTLSGYKSQLSSIAVSRQGEATYRESYAYSDGAMTYRYRYAGPQSAGGSALEQTNITYDVKKEKLDTTRPLSITIARSDGAKTRVSKVEYDATTRLPLKTYLDGGADGQMGNVMTFDAEGRLKTQANFASFSTDGVATTTTTYGADGYPSSATTAYTRPANQTGAASITESATYDSAGRTLTATDSLGVQTAYTYDTFGRMTSSARQGEAAITYGYPDKWTQTITREGRTTTERMDGFGRLVRRTLPDGRRTDFFYDAHGRLVAQKEFNQAGSASLASSMTYDALDRPTGSSSSTGAKQTITYSATADLKQSITTTSVAGVAQGQKEYRDVTGQVVKVEEPTGGVTTFTYMPWDGRQQIDIKDPSGSIQTRQYLYNALGLLWGKVEPEATGNTNFGTFNALGKPTRITEAATTPDQRISTILYDGLGRVCKVTSSTGTETLENFFDGALLVKSLGGGVNPVTMTFGYKTAAEGRRLASESTALAGVTHTLNYAYQPSGRLSTVGYPSGRTVSYSYDADGRPTGVLAISGGVSTSVVSNVSFDEWGTRRRLTFGSTAYSDWSTFNPATRQQTWTIGYTTGGLGDPANPRLHTYDLAERLTQAGEWKNLLHDSANRLAHAEAPSLNVTSVDLGHDAFGNNIRHQATGTAASSFNNFSFEPLAGWDDAITETLHPGNQLPESTLTGGLTGWNVNARGEASGIGVGVSTLHQGLTMVWDALGRLKNLKGYFPALTQNQIYTYAPSGLRIRVQDAATPANNRRYAYAASGELMSEYTDAGWKRDVVYLDGEVVAEIDAAGIHELHNDHLGTPRLITSRATGQIEGKQAYGPYGEYLSASAAGYKPLTGYTGHLQTEPSGLIYMRGRFYSPAWHRFVNPDQGADPNSWNQMAYVGGSPFMAMDPSGMALCFLGWEFVHHEIYGLPTPDGRWVEVWGECEGGGSPPSPGTGNGNVNGNGSGSNPTSPNQSQTDEERKRDCIEAIRAALAPMRQQALSMRNQRIASANSFAGTMSQFNKGYTESTSWKKNKVGFIAGIIAGTSSAHFGKEAYSLGQQGRINPNLIQRGNRAGGWGLAFLASGYLGKSIAGVGQIMNRTDVMDINTEYNEIMLNLHNAEKALIRNLCN